MVNLDTLFPNKVLNNSVVDIEKGMELKHDFQKFYSYIEKAIPKSEYLVNNFEQIGEEEAEEKIMGKASTVQWDKKTMDERTVRELDSLRKEIGSEFDTLSKDIDLKLDATFELTGKEKLEVHNDLEEDDTDIVRKEEEVFKQIYQKGIDQYKVFPKTAILGSMVMANSKKINAADELLIFEQEGFTDKPAIRTNWIYVFGLPFDLESYGEGEIKESVFKAVSRIGEVKHVLISSYKDFLSENRSTVLIPKKIGAFFENFIHRWFPKDSYLQPTIEKFHDISNPINSNSDPGTHLDQILAARSTLESEDIQKSGEEQKNLKNQK